jgi:antitoxin MazE
LHNSYENPDVDVFVAGSDAFGLAKAQRANEADQLLERVRALRGTVPKDFKFDRLEANAR